MEPTLQNAELAAYVVAAVQLVKPILKDKVPANYQTLVLVALSAAFGGFFNAALYDLTWEIVSQGLFVGAAASGAFGTVKEVLSAKKKK